MENEIKKSIKLKGLSVLFLPFVIIFVEIMLAYYNKFDINQYAWQGMLLAALAVGILLEVFASSFKSERVNGWIHFIISEIITIFYIIEHFCNDSYSAFMSIPSLLTGTEGVATEFGDVVIGVIKNGIGKILVFHIPSLIILTLCVIKKMPVARTNWKKTIAFVLCCALFFGGGYYLQTSNELHKDKYTYDYIFDDAVRTFGMGTAVLLDTVYQLTGVPQSPIPPIPPEPIKPTSYPKNKLPIDWRSLSEEVTDKNAKETFEYIMNSQGSSKHEYTGIFKDKNLVVITVESFSKELVREDFFPTIYRMATKGIVIEDYYQPLWGGSTTSGECAVMTGQIPTDAAKTMQKLIPNDNGYTIAPILKDMGYSTIAYHNGHATFYNRDKTHPALGFSKFYADGTGMEDYLSFLDTKPRSDEEMFKFIADDLRNYTGKFYAYVMTYSGHCFYNFSVNPIGHKNRYILKGTPYYNQKRIGGYIAGSYDLELGLNYLINDFKERGILDDTVFVITADHYPYALQDGEVWYNETNYLLDLYGYIPENCVQRDHNAMIIWSPCLEDLEEQIVVTDPCYSPDITPTVLNLFGADFDSRLYAGRDIISEADPLVIWANSSWMTDKGFYDSTTGTFTKGRFDITSGEFVGGENIEVSKDYISQIKATVRSKMTLSRNMIRQNLYKTIREYLH